MPEPLTFFLLLPISSLFFFSKTSHGNALASNCPSHKCGVKIDYPFWLQSDATAYQYCGYPGFNLTCSYPETILNLQGESFYVKNISYADYTLTLVDVEVSSQTCPRARQNVTLQTLPLSYSSLDLNLSFYYNCSGVEIKAVPIGCLSSGENESYVFVCETEPAKFRNWYDFCEEKVVVTVTDSEIDETMGFDGAMKDGFVLDWRQAVACGACEASGGRCGHNTVNDDYLCFCSDGSPRTNATCKGDEWNIGRKLAIGFGASGGTLLIMCVLFFLHQHRNKKRYGTPSWIPRSISFFPSSATDPEQAGAIYGVHIFKYSELEKATGNFDSEKELGDGGFGTVYQGKLKDGRDVAVKRLYEHNYKRMEQFMNEVEILARLRHKNLVSLYGCTSRHCRELLLVYEYVPNGTVADHLHGDRAKPGSLSWTTRLSIAVETANALTYLHHSDVIHRDVKTNNILLDNNFCVKVADFGLSRLFPTNVTHVSTAPQGTPGYVDPEYHECYQLTNKSDVYSFGVVLIELISSKPAVDITRHRHEINLSTMAVNKIQNHALHELIDPYLGFETDFKAREMISEVAELAFQCLQSERDMRPSMEKVLETLKGIQSEDWKLRKPEEVEILSDELVLLKSDPPTLSPDSLAKSSIARGSNSR
ncbi:LEAF RUST 10 DISEASE-RESISTANCE LOCUS RECEPTOR-LIKE PROTEIN KINASE-like 1.2 isoform X2 [Rhododendron vialii]|uniref:LEAF RUST 10 DISEASE-RESISTANCE LOCUS RECEPTOR-LIKE PROTEIN KINASE-like 1.2 isoform X2 n=1 Tax=Rhododendron vialii TaxID=182163 RepID=UPI00265DAD5F|nr:LEAF RUST 10 DISEASE-RESISTANCE LOCUS RECEPTOR-LIKE PROTEIN KINASE-like 1.2 isoform X2 [Rhododendron vialii]